MPWAAWMLPQTRSGLHLTVVGLVPGTCWWYRVLHTAYRYGAIGRAIGRASRAKPLSLGWRSTFPLNISISYSNINHLGCYVYIIHTQVCILSSTNPRMGKSIKAWEHQKMIGEKKLDKTISATNHKKIQLSRTSLALLLTTKQASPSRGALPGNCCNGTAAVPHHYCGTVVCS